MSEIIIRKEGRAGRITLNRPETLNGLTHEMVTEIEQALDRWTEDEDVFLVLIDAEGGRAFSAGGDIQKLYETGKAGDYDYGRRFWRDEYRVNAKIANYPKPYAALMDGIVMGGGIGVSGHGSHRIVTERTMAAMPECGIGLVPDVGGTWLLSRAPGRAGEYLGLTGARMSAADAIHAGFADAFVPSDVLGDLAAKLCESGDPAVIEEFAKPAGDSALAAQAHEIDHCFAGASALDCVSAIEALETDWAQKAAKAIRRNSPIAITCTLDAVRTAREFERLEQSLDLEYRYVARAMEQGDFLEGIRAALIDRDRKPKWDPARLEDVTPEMTAAMLAPLKEGALEDA